MANRRRKRKRDAKYAKDYDSEHVNKRGKKLCSGLNGMRMPIIKYMKKYWHLFNIDYDNLQLGELNALSNELYFNFFICDGNKEQMNENDISQCIDCHSVSQKLAEAYKQFSDSFVEEVCEFMDTLSARQRCRDWKNASISLLEKNEDFTFILQPSLQYIGLRNIHFIITEQCIQLISDIANAPKDYPFGSGHCSAKQMLRFFEKRLSAKSVCCQGVANEFEDFTESEYGAIYSTACLL